MDNDPNDWILLPQAVKASRWISTFLFTILFSTQHGRIYPWKLHRGHIRNSLLVYIMMFREIWTLIFKDKWYLTFTYSPWPHRRFSRRSIFWLTLGSFFKVYACVINIKLSPFEIQMALSKILNKNLQYNIKMYLFRCNFIS